MPRTAEGFSSLPPPLPPTTGELPRTLDPRRLPQTLPYSESGPLREEGVGDRPRTCREPDERARCGVPPPAPSAAFDEPFSFATAMGSGGVAVAGEGGARDWASVIGSLIRGRQSRVRGGAREEEEEENATRGSEAFSLLEKRMRMTMVEHAGEG